MPTDTDLPPPDALLPNGRPRLRPLVGVPTLKEDRKGGLLLSILFHGALIALVLLPAAYATTKVLEVEGAGGAGPAGGGGGGRGGTGGIPERIKYVEVAPAAAPAPTPQPVVTPPEVKPPEVKPPEVKPPVTPPPTPRPTTAAPTPAPPATQASAPTPGTGGGVGADGTAGSGPGTGGGVGTGQGTGTGSSVGPGTGGGNATVYPPTPTQMILPPQPVPGKAKGLKLTATFDVDSTGKVLAFDFAPQTRDNGYNKRLRDVLAEVRFRPGFRGDGRPVRANYSFSIELF